MVGIDTVRIEKVKLQKVVATNRKIHEREYNEAMVGYRAKVVGTLEEELVKAKHGEDVKFMHLPKPEEHFDEYDNVLGMLDYSVDEIVELDYDQFRQYVRDEWQWTRHFKASNASYTTEVKRHR